MEKPKLDVPADDAPRDVSRPALRREGALDAPGVIPSPETDSRTHQRFSGEGLSRKERDEAKRGRKE